MPVRPVSPVLASLDGCLHALMSEKIEVNDSVESDRSSTQSLEDGFKLLVLLFNPNTGNPTLDMLTIDANVQLEGALMHSMMLLSFL